MSSVAIRTLSGSVKRLRTRSLDSIPAPVLGQPQAAVPVLAQAPTGAMTSSAAFSIQAPAKIEMAEFRSIFGGADGGADVDQILRSIPTTATTVSDAEALPAPAIKDQMRVLTYLLPDLDVKAIVSKCPELLTLNVEEELLPRIISLKSLLPGASFTRTLQENPSILLKPAYSRCSSLEV